MHCIMISLGVRMTVLGEVIPLRADQPSAHSYPLKRLQTQYTIIIPSPNVNTEMILNTVNISLYAKRLKEVILVNKSSL